VSLKKVVSAVLPSIYLAWSPLLCEYAFFVMDCGRPPVACTLVDTALHFNWTDHVYPYPAHFPVPVCDSPDACRRPVGSLVARHCHFGLLKLNQRKSGTVIISNEITKNERRTQPDRNTRRERVPVAKADPSFVCSSKHKYFFNLRHILFSFAL
jgi:hypothetical protein